MISKKNNSKNIKEFISKLVCLLATVATYTYTMYANWLRYLHFDLAYRIISINLLIAS